MTETNMPAAEAAVASHDDERVSYELAFHVLPTVAEGEVAQVTEAIKALVTDHGGQMTTEEKPERFDLAYEIIKHIDGKNRRFTSAYFGWVRFTATPDQVPALMEEVEGHAAILRALLVKLTKAEEAHPFRFHEALAADKKVVNIEEAAPEAPTAPEVAEEKAAEETEAETETETAEVTTKEEAPVEETEETKA